MRRDGEERVYEHRNSGITHQRPREPEGFWDDVVNIDGVLSSVTLMGCGEDETYDQIGIEELEQVSAITAEPAKAILYLNVDFKVTDHIIPQSCIGNDCTYNYHRGRVESAIVYPGCSITFFYSSSIGGKTYDATDGKPYYISSLNRDLRKQWNEVTSRCSGDPVLSHDAMAWSEPGQTGERLPLFTGQDWRYPNWFRNEVSSF